MRRASLFFLCVGVVTMSCEDGDYPASYLNDALFGEEACQCVTPDKMNTADEQIAPRPSDAVCDPSSDEQRAQQFLYVSSDMFR